jgi:hypothetical protein
MSFEIHFKLRYITLLAWILSQSLALIPCNPNHKFYVNRISATCSAPGAIPLNATGTYLGYDLGIAARSGESISLVLENSCVPQLSTCQSSLSNLQSRSAAASGWMQPIAAGYRAFNGSSPTELAINQSDSDRGIAAMRAGCYSVCWQNSTGSWTNLGIIVNVQGDFLGFEFNGLRNANGLRAGIPRWYTAALLALPSRENITLSMR